MNSNIFYKYIMPEPQTADVGHLIEFDKSFSVQPEKREPVSKTESPKIESIECNLSSEQLIARRIIRANRSLKIYIPAFDNSILTSKIICAAIHKVACKKEKITVEIVMGDYSTEDTRKNLFSQIARKHKSRIKVKHIKTYSSETRRLPFLIIDYKGTLEWKKEGDMGSFINKNDHTRNRMLREKYAPLWDYSHEIAQFQ